MKLALTLRHYWHLMLHKAYADFRSESERTYLGVIWWVLEPLIDMGIYYLVFGYFFQSGDHDYMPFLLVGLVVWRYFNVTVMRASNSILANVGIVRQLPFKKIIFPFIALTTCSMEFGFSLLLLFSFLFLWGYDITIYWAALPLLLFAEILLILALALPLAAVVPLMPDLQKLVGYAMRVGFFMSGILYSISRLPEAAQFYLRYNPVVPIVDGFRDILMYERWPNWEALALVTMASTVIAVAGFCLFEKFDMLFAKRITR